MLKLFRKQRAGAASPSFSAPAGADSLIYAIGDIHGRQDLLLRLLEQIFLDAQDRDARVKLVFLGDYVDRGEGARETIDVLIQIADWEEIDCVFLMGNHEQMLLRFLRDPTAGAGWLRFGGLQTLMSYDVAVSGSLRNADEARRVRDALTEALGPHLNFIEGLVPCHLNGNLLFVHAGADPALPADEQEIATLLWGCTGSETVARDDGFWVVHGHVVVDQPVAENGRISVDTGAYFTGRLTAARIADGAVHFIEG